MSLIKLFPSSSFAFGQRLHIVPFKACDRFFTFFFSFSFSPYLCFTFFIFIGGLRAAFYTLFSYRKFHHLLLPLYSIVSLLHNKTTPEEKLSHFIVWSKYLGEILLFHIFAIFFLLLICFSCPILAFWWLTQPFHGHFYTHRQHFVAAFTNRRICNFG